MPSYVNLPNLWSVNYVRKIFCQIKINRRKAKVKESTSNGSLRKVQNEEELLSILNKYNFKSIVLEKCHSKNNWKPFTTPRLSLLPMAPDQLLKVLLLVV